MEFKVYQMNKINSDQVIPSVIDGLILFHITEDRSYNVLDQLSIKNRIPADIMIISFDDIDSELVKSIQNKYKLNVFLVRIETDLSEDLLDCLRAVNNYLALKNVIGIDISCMPIPIFIRFMHFLFNKHSGIQLIIYYSEPTHYNLNNLFDFSAYSGEIDIKAIPGYEGKTSKLDESQRIIFYIMGFELDYLNKLIPQETNPDDIVPINGFPSYFPKYKDISLINNNFNFHEKNIQIIFAEANNPFAIYNQMVLLMNKNSKYCIDIIPAGPKPMALGACLFALKNGNNDIRILFPFPSEYKSKQSSGKGAIWEYII